MFDSDFAGLRASEGCGRTTGLGCMPACEADSLSLDMQTVGGDVHQVLSSVLSRSRCPHCGASLNSFRLPKAGKCGVCSKCFSANRTEARLIDGFIFALSVPLLVLVLFAVYRGLGRAFTWDDWGWWIVPLGLVSHLLWYPRLLRLSKS